MIEIQLTDKEFALIKESYEFQKLKPNFGHRVYITFNDDYDDNLNGLCDVISDYFIIKGLDKDYEPNKLGLQLEELKGKVLKVLYGLNDGNKDK